MKNSNFYILHVQAFFDFDHALQVMRYQNKKFGTRIFLIKKKKLSDVPVFILALLKRKQDLTGAN